MKFLLLNLLFCYSLHDTPCTFEKHNNFYVPSISVKSLQPFTYTICSYDGKRKEAFYACTKPASQGCRIATTQGTYDSAYPCTEYTNGGNND